MDLLVIDDNDGVRALVRTFAEVAGCESSAEARTGERALELAAARRFDAAIVDFHMPGIDGLQTTRRLLELQPAMSIVAWTSVVDPGVESAFVEAGALCHVPKTDTVALRRVLEGLCGDQETITSPGP